jgi:hypothetical protein
MSLCESKSWYSNNCIHFLKSAVPLQQKFGVEIEFKNEFLLMGELENDSAAENKRNTCLICSFEFSYR